MDLADRPLLGGSAYPHCSHATDVFAGKGVVGLTGSVARAAHVVAFFSAKGGSGKTTIATNLAAALGKDGERRVCLVDLDLRSGDVATALQLESQCTLSNAVAIGSPMDAEKLSLIAIRTEFRFDCILAPGRPGDAERIGPDFVGALLDAVVPLYDFVLLDLSTGFSSTALLALDRAAQHILVATPERPSLRSLRGTLDVLDLLGYSPCSRSVLSNRSDSQVGITAADASAMIRTNIAAHIPSSRDVPMSINRGIPLTVWNPDHPVSLAIAHFAGAINAFQSQEVHAPPKT
jgi:pilus assembly protein CpaE